MMKKMIIPVAIMVAITMAMCRSAERQHQHGETGAPAYTCPMPEDSVFSDTPGRCPKCGMDLVKVDTGEDEELESLSRATNEFVRSSLPVISLEKRSEDIEIEALGSVEYDTRAAAAISSRVSGRIERLYVRYRFQEIRRGQRIMDVYSPELATAQETLLYLLRNDPSNLGIIEAAREKLLLLGMDRRQLEEVVRSRKPAELIAVYSSYAGHIHEATDPSGMRPDGDGAMRDIARLTGELGIREGMYVEKGKTIFTIYNPARAWALLSIYAEDHAMVKVGNPARIVPETAPGKDFRAEVGFIEPFYRKDSKTVTARVPFDNSRLRIPIGSQVKAVIFGNAKDAYWLPTDAVVSLGLDMVVFVKAGDGFVARKIKTGVRHRQHVQVTGGLTPDESVASNAQYLVDSESFIKPKE